MDAKDLTIIVGAATTFLVGIISAIVSISINIINLKNTRKSKYIDVITAERIKWMEKLRVDISRYAGLSSFWLKTIRSTTDAEGKADIKELDNLRYLIMLRLNPKGDIDQEIMRIINVVPTLSIETDIKKIDKELNLLIEASQKLLKEEWNRVKKESKKGIETKAINTL